MATATGEAGAGVSFDKPELNANPCEFRIVLPIPTLNLVLPAIPFPPFPLPIFNLSLSLTCSLDNPIDVSGGLAFGGGRTPCFDPSPDDEEDDPRDGTGTRAGGV